MPLDRDTVLLETVRAHRERLAAALLFGEQVARRPAVSQLKAVVAGLVLAALVGAGCVGYAVARDLLVQQQPSTGARR